MHKIRTALAATAITMVMGAVLASPAEAAPDPIAGPVCDSMFRYYQYDGYFRAFDGFDCDTQIGAAQGNDANWNDVSGPFRSPSNDRASSLMNTGTEAGGVNNVLVYSNSGYSGYWGCLGWSEFYVDNLSDNTLVNASGARTSANNSISSHQWSASCSNPLT